MLSLIAIGHRGERHPPLGLRFHSRRFGIKEALRPMQGRIEPSGIRRGEPLAGLRRNLRRGHDSSMAP